MANDLSVLVKVIGPVVQETLRKRGGLFTYCDGDYSTLALQKGDTIDAVFAASLTATDITPSPSGTQAPSVTPTKVSLVLDNWKEASFFLTHKQMQEITDETAFIQQQVAAGVEAIMGAMETTFFTEAYTSSSNHITTYASNNLAALTSSLAPIVTARKNLSNAYAPLNDRYFVMGTTEAANLLQNTQLQKVNEAGGSSFLREGALGRIMGVDLVESNFVPTLSSASLASIVDVGTGNSGSANVLLQRGGMGIAVRAANAGTNVVVITDPISGAPLTLTIWQQEYQTKWSISALWGCKTIRPTFTNILWG